MTVSSNASRCVPATAEADAAERARWSLRARGTGRGVLRLWYATRRWDGRVELSLDEALRREREVAPRGRGPLWSTPDPFALRER